MPARLTLFHLLSGHLKPSEGEIWFDDRDITRLPAHQRARAGVARSFQVTNLLQEMTVLEMCIMAVYGRHGSPFAFVRPLLDHRAERVRAEALLDNWGLLDRRDAPIQALSYGDQRLLEIVIALAQDPHLILLDEPTAGLSQLESRAADHGHPAAPAPHARAHRARPERRLRAGRQHYCR